MRNESPRPALITQRSNGLRMVVPGRTQALPAYRCRMTTRRFLMCRPTYFAVTYRINPWMDPTAPYDNVLAVSQWENLRRVFLDLGHTVELIDPLPGLPDMVFAANGGTIIDGRALGVQF